MKTHYACAELAALRLPEYPGSSQGWGKLVARESWPFREEKSRGRDGVKRLYAPPANVLKLIRDAEQRIIDVMVASDQAAELVAEIYGEEKPGATTHPAPATVSLTIAVSLVEAAAITQWLHGRGRK